MLKKNKEEKKSLPKTHPTNSNTNRRGKCYNYGDERGFTFYIIVSLMDHLYDFNCCKGDMRAFIRQMFPIVLSVHILKSLFQLHDQ